ncbi:fimbrial protein, partial [Bacteroides sp.]
MIRALIRHSVSHLETGISLLLLLFLVSCSQDVPVSSDSQSGGDGLTTGRTVRLELSLQMASMPGAADGVTRAEVPLSADEAAIRSLRVLQFGGTADGSLLVKKGEVPASDIAEGQFVFDFEELIEGGAMTVYLLANLPIAALDGVTESATTLGAFKAGNLSVNPLTEDAMKTNGLPMIASQSFDYTTGAPGAFSL